ncbi:hypothetical protein ACPWT1_04070 [Ramlibacter sp. MMS24-I3-19]
MLARRGWEVLLAVIPRQLLRGLDAWARRRAQARAERRRRLLRASQPR